MFKTFCVLGVKSRVDLLTMNRHTASQIEGKREKRKLKRGNRNALGKKETEKWKPYYTYRLAVMSTVTVIQDVGVCIV